MEKLLHVLSAKQFTRSLLDDFIKDTQRVEEIIKSGKRINIFDGRIVKVFTWFGQPSTRTKCSFQSAAESIGAIVSDGGDSPQKFSSVIKGESFFDTMLSIASINKDIIILRDKDENAMNIAVEASELAFFKQLHDNPNGEHKPRIPIINGGSGNNEHPTQALLDMYTIHKIKGRILNLKVAMVGDLKNSRTVRSLCQLLALHGSNKIYFVSPKKLKMKNDILEYLKEKGIKYYFVDDVRDLKDVDIIYMTRTQKEWMKKSWFAKIFRRTELKRNKKYIINKEVMDVLSSDTYIMHPLPRNEEISPEVDNDPRAKYIMQMECGFFVRIAILKWCLYGIYKECTTA